jgi:hypothetical protein
MDTEACRWQRQPDAIQTGWRNANARTWRAFARSFCEGRSTELRHHLHITLLVKGLQRFRRGLYGHKFLQFRHPDALALEIRQEATALLVIGVGDVVPVLGTCPREFATLRH